MTIWHLAAFLEAVIIAGALAVILLAEFESNRSSSHE